ncbi:MAG: DUF6261 family protein [Paludibacter sp.]
MKSAFIKLRFDRLKIIELKSLYQSIVYFLKSIDQNELHLEWATNHLIKQEVLVDNLRTKTRKLPLTDEIAHLHKVRDNLMSALILNSKALVRAGFNDFQQIDKRIFSLVYDTIQYDIHERLTIKDRKIDNLIRTVKEDEQMRMDFELLGLIRYIKALEDNKKQIAEQKKNRRMKMKANPVGFALKNKNQLIAEIQTFITAFNLNIIQHPEIDYSQTVRIIDSLMINCRGQLRNRASRRKTAQEKELLKTQQVENEE